MRYLILKLFTPTFRISKIDHSNSLVEVGAFPTILADLWLAFFGSLRKIGELCTLSKLQTLGIYCYKGLKELPTLETLASLEKLGASDCCNGLSQVTKLQTLSFHLCSELMRFSMLSIWGLWRGVWPLNVSNSSGVRKWSGCARKASLYENKLLLLSYCK